MAQNITVVDIIDILGQVPPTQFLVLNLLTEFLETGGNPDWLSKNAQIIEEATTVAKVAIEQVKVVKKQCLNLRPFPSPWIPLGF